MLCPPKTQPGLSLYPREKTLRPSRRQGKRKKKEGEDQPNITLTSLLTQGSLAACRLPFHDVLFLPRPMRPIALTVILAVSITARGNRLTNSWSPRGDALD